MARRHPRPAIRHQFLRRAPCNCAAKRCLSCSAGRKRPSLPRFSLNAAHCAPGICPAIGSMGSTSPRKRGWARASIKVRPGWPRRFAGVRHPATGDDPAYRRRYLAQPQARPGSGETRGMPGLEATIQDKHAITLAQPGQQPPGTGGVGTGAVVIQHHIGIGADAPGPQLPGERVRRRQG